MSPDLWPRALGFLDGWKRSHHHKHGCPKRALAVFSHDPKVRGRRELATRLSLLTWQMEIAMLPSGSMRVVNKLTEGGAWTRCAEGCAVK